MDSPIATSLSLNAKTEQSQRSNTEHASQVDSQNTKKVVKEPPPQYPLYSWRSKSPNSRLVYIRDYEMAELELAKLKPGPVGFDLEWKPVFRKGGSNPVALVQLATEDTILLIQVTAMQTFPERLRQLLVDPSYLKAGVGIQGDVKKLWQDYGVNTRNCVDLGLLARTVDNARWKGNYNQAIGLARLCQTYHNLDLTKGKITRSNWELVLDERQQDYAANDCHSGLTLYLQLHSMIAAVEPAPSKPYFTFDIVNGLLYHPSDEETSRLLWHPHNPNYDPGPPPEKKEKESGENGAKTGGASEQRTRARGRSTHQQPSSGPPGITHPAQADSGPSAGSYHGAPQMPSTTQQVRNFGQSVKWKPWMQPMYDPVAGFVQPTQPTRGRGRGRGGSGGRRKGGHGSTPATG